MTSIATYQMKYLLFGESHFASADDTTASLEAITRDDLVAFHARLLHPANLFVAASGQFDRKAMVDALDRTVGALKAGREARVSPAVPAPDFPRTPGIYVTDKDAPQAMIRWAFPGIRRTDPDWHAAFVTNQILGGRGFTSRLMKKIRSDEGLTYGVYSTLEPGTYWRGDVTGGLQTKNRSVAYALRLALDEIRKLKEQPVSDDELRVNKDGIIEAFPSQWATPPGGREPLRGRGPRGLARGLVGELPGEDPGRHRRRRAADGQEALRHRPDRDPRRGQGLRDGAGRHGPPGRPQGRGAAAAEGACRSATRRRSKPMP